MQGEADINNEQKDGTNMTFEIKNAQENTILELPYIYYSGYSVTLKINNIEKQLKTYESDNGFVEIILEESIENGKITVSYTGTNIIKISAIISLLSFTIMIIYYLKNKY